jgi:TP901 family phage tail tape measure protein
MLREKAKQMGADTAFSASEAAEGLNILAMSGYSAEDSCAMIKDVLDLAAAGSLGLADAAKYTSGAVKGFADDTKDAQYYTDLMAKGATLANTSVGELGEALSSGAATAASYGQDAEDLTLALLRMAEQGETGSNATTKLNRAMADLYTATPQAAEALKKLGVSAYDSSGAARDFNTVVDDLNKALAGMSDEEANAYKNTIFTANGLQAFNKMTVTSTDKVNEWAEALQTATPSIDQISAKLDESGIAWEKYADNAWMKTGSGVEGLTKQIMFNLKEQGLSVEETADFIASEYDMAMDDAKAAVESVSDAMKGSAAQQADTMLDNLQGDMKLFGSAAEGAKIALSDALSPALREMVQFGTGAVGPITEGFESGGLAGAADKLMEKIPEAIEKFLPKIIHAVTNVTQQLVRALPRILSAIGSALPALLDGIMQIAPVLGKAALEIIKTLGDGLAKSLPTLVPTIIDIALEIVDILTNPDTLSTLIDASIAIVIALTDGIINSLPKLIERLPELVDQLVNGIIDNLDKLLDAAVQVVEKFAGYLFDPENADKIITAGMEIITKIAKGLGDALWKITAKVKEIAKEIADKLGIGEYWEAGQQVIDDFMNGVKAKWDEWESWWEGIGERIFDWLHPDFSGDSMIDESAVWQPPVPAMASGGIVTRPTRALIGENGQELVLPLERNTGWMDQLAAKIGGGGITIGSVQITVPAGSDGRQIARSFVAELDTQLRNRQIAQGRGTGGAGWAI